MLRRLGYVAIALSIDASTNRTCRLRNATPERLRTLIETNLLGLREILVYNVDQEILLYRISSQIVPFASHDVNEIRWWEEFADLFDEIGAFIRAHGIRVSMHPGQFTVLNSVNPDTVTASVRELEWHVRLLDALGVDASNKLILHIGGMAGGKEAAIDRFVSVANGLPEATRRRLVIENDERLYAAADVVAISERTGIPVVFDWLHHTANRGDSIDDKQAIQACFATWRQRDGVPKIHLSSQETSGPPGKHAEWVDPADVEAVLRVAPDTPFDCMLEAKQKDRALLRLREDLRARDISELVY